MSFDINMPLPNQTLGQTNARIRENWDKLNTDFTVNHVAHVTTGADVGKHTKIEFDTNHAAGVPAGTQSEIYTGGATPEAYFHNSLNTSHLSGIKAWCVFTSANPPVLDATSHNVASITRLATGQYRVDFTNALTTTTYCVQVTREGGVGPGLGDTVEAFTRNANNCTVISRSLLDQLVKDVGGKIHVLVIGY